MGGAEPLMVHFAASATGGTAPYNFTWDPEDGSANATGVYFNDTYTKQGVYDAMLLGNDSANSSSRAEVTITVGTDSWYNLPSSQTQPLWSYEASMTCTTRRSAASCSSAARRRCHRTPSRTRRGSTSGASGRTSRRPCPWRRALVTVPGWSTTANDLYALLFGGMSTSCGTSSYYYYYYDYCNDTWTFTPTGGWTQIYPTVSPDPRYDFAMADYPADGYVVLFGGTCLGCAGYYYTSQADDTWIFHGGQWTDWTANTTKSPGAVAFTAAVYDAAAGYVLMFGGWNYCSASTSQTWTFSRGNWTELTISTQPPGVVYGSLAYDSALGQAVYFGGEESKCAKTYNETWTYSNGTWTDVTSMTVGAPQPDSYTAMAYDPAVGAAVFLGNRGQTNGSKTVEPVGPGRDPR